jgi:hypothetical protein
VKIITILYVQNGSVYETIPGCDLWDRTRDARSYSGPAPVIAHPPCGHWGKYRHRCNLDGRDCASIALSQVRLYGGILEHPIGSQLWLHCVKPGEGVDLWGAVTIDLMQHDYGHPALKPTRLYVCRQHLILPPPCTTQEEIRKLERLSHRQRAATPATLATALVNSLRQN